VTGHRVPRKGDIVWVLLSRRAGHEQSGHRPALVLSPESYNAKVGLAVLCPVASQEKGYPFEVSLPEGLPVSGVVLSDQVTSIDWRVRGAEFICESSPAIVRDVLRGLDSLIGV